MHLGDPGEDSAPARPRRRHGLRTRLLVVIVVVAMVLTTVLSALLSLGARSTPPTTVPNVVTAMEPTGPDEPSLSGG